MPLSEEEERSILVNIGVLVERQKTVIDIVNELKDKSHSTPCRELDRLETTLRAKVGTYGRIGTVILGVASLVTVGIQVYKVFH